MILSIVSSLNKRDVRWTVYYRNKTWRLTYDSCFKEQILWFAGLTFFLLFNVNFSMTYECYEAILLRFDAD